MKAILVNSDRSLSWSDVPDPVIKPEEVLVEIHYAALNRADLMQREGDYPPPEGCPEWMGLEISGVITEIGNEAKEKSDWKIGDKVCALLGGGGYAQYAAVKYDMRMPVPESCSMAEAAAIPEAFATAYLNLFIEGNMKSGDVVLMNAGLSGLASAVIPMAKAFGATVVTSVRKDGFEDYLTKLGADVIVNTGTLSVAAAMEKLENEQRPVDIAIDCVGGNAVGECVKHMSHGGRWIMIASLAGRETQLDLKDVYVRNTRIIGSTLRSRHPSVKSEILAKLVEDVFPYIESGTLKPEIYKVLPVEECEEAHRILCDGENVGKVVLKIKN